MPTRQLNAKIEYKLSEIVLRVQRRFTRCIGWPITSLLIYVNCNKRKWCGIRHVR